MKHLMNVRQMKEVDRYSIEEIGIPALVLMEKAACEVAQLLYEATGENDKILAVCGTGNNGGDAVAAARILHERGRQTAVLVIGAEEKATPEQKRQLSIARKSGVAIRGKEALDEYNVIIDGIFGIGLCREITGEYYEIIDRINCGKHHVVAVDIPSGVSGDSGQIQGIAVRADETVTFGYGKPGLYLFPGCEYAGKVWIKDIGFPGVVEEKINPRCFFYEKEDLGRLPERRSYSNKGSYGKLLIAGGAKGMGGACIMAARAALSCGAGLVKIVAAEENRGIIQSSLPEAMFAPWAEIEKAASWADMAVLGPGLSQTEKSQRVFEALWEKEELPLVLDADGLNLLAKLGGIDYSKRDNVIFTPHLKEMERLSGLSVREIQENMLETARRYGKKNGILVLKDARSVVSDGEQIYVNLTGNSALAKGGSGDVLAGIIGGLAAQGAELFEAACLGVFLHGMAADHYVETKSPRSLMASELTEELRWILP